MPVGIRPACQADETLIKNIFNMYQNELGVYSNDFMSLDANGYFDESTVCDILPFGDGVYPYIVTMDGAVIGFIMVTEGAYAPEGCRYCFQELFIIASRRGSGAAYDAARLAMKGRIGRWGLNVYEKNLRARAFWTKLTGLCGENLKSRPGEENMIEMSFDYAGEGKT
ncbi:MAG: hypothetical protein IJC48_10720 [Clostridia bacterium]|nr:hypothetical protein [Clostridia bacterium]